MANDKLFSNIPQLNTEKDWPVLKFHVTQALKAVDQWEFITGEADSSTQGYESKKQRLSIQYYSVLDKRMCML